MDWLKCEWTLATTMSGESGVVEVESAVGEDVDLDAWEDAEV